MVDWALAVLYGRAFIVGEWGLHEHPAEDGRPTCNPT
jgi:hypothetical protein